MDKQISINSTGDHVISEVEPGDDEGRIVYWPDAYPNRNAAKHAVAIVEAGGYNPQPSIKVDMNTGERI